MTAATNDELVSLINAAPDDLANWLLYSDWLQEKNEPRGELMTIDVALETAKGARKTELEQSRAEFVKTHAVVLFGDVFSKVVKEGYGTVAWHRGFVEEVSYLGVSTNHKRAVRWLIAAMCDQPEPFVFLRRIKLKGTDFADLASLAKFKTLVEIDVADTEVRDIKPLLTEFPNLKSVNLRGCGIKKDVAATLVERGIRTRL